MKKTLTLLLAAVLTLSLFTGCGSNKYVTLGEYKGLEVTVTKNTYTESELKELALAAYQSGVTVDNGAVTDRPVENGDIVVIDFEGRLDGVAFDGGSASDYQLGIGTGTFIEGFEEGLIGVNPGETVDLNLTFPDNYQSTDLAGQAVVFTVTVDYILPNADEMEDSVVAGFNNELYSTVEELNQYAVQYLEEYYEQEYQSNIDSAVIEAVMSHTVVDKLPEKEVTAYAEKLNTAYSSYAASYGVDMDTFMTYMFGSDVNTLAQDYVRQSLTLQAIAEKEGIKVTDEEVAESAAAEAEETGVDVETYLKTMGEEDYKESLLLQKVMDFLVENTVVITE